MRGSGTFSRASVSDPAADLFLKRRPLGAAGGPVLLQVWVERETKCLLAVRVFPLDGNNKPKPTGEQVLIQGYQETGGRQFPKHLILARVDTSAVPASLLAYERLRRERVAEIQRGARQNGLRVDSAAADLSVRDAQLAAHAEFRKHLYSYDVVADARSAAAALQP